MSEYYLVLSVGANIILFITVFVQHEALTKLWRKNDNLEKRSDAYRKMLAHHVTSGGEDRGY